MSALLPPPEPPADEVTELRDLIAFCRTHRDLTEQRLTRARAYADDPHATLSDRIHTRILVAVRERELELWEAQLGDLHDALAGAVTARGCEE